MDKNQIIEIAFETIRESTEWGIEEEDCKAYGHFVDGVVTKKQEKQLNGEIKKTLEEVRF